MKLLPCWRMKPGCPVTNSGPDPLVGVVWADAGTSAEEVPVKLNV